MKIIQFIPQLGSGGGERFTVDLCNELSLGNEVILLVSHSLEKEGFYKDEIDHRVKIICFNKTKGFDWKLPFRVFYLIHKEKPDVVHTHLMALVYTSIAAIFNRKSHYFHTVHNSAKEETDGKIGEMVRRFLFSMGLVNPVTISQDSNRSFVEFYHREAKMIPNGRNIPSTIFVSEEVKKEFKRYRSSCSTRVIVQLAHVGAQKRQNVMARVVDKLIKEGNDIELLFIGKVCDTIMEQEILSLCNPHIHFLGLKSNPLEYLTLADGFALCSSFEGLPISLIEALATSTIPICTPVGGIVNVIKDGYNGFLANSISEDDYYTAMQRFMSMSDADFEQMKQAAFASYKPYSMTECCSNYVKLYNEIL